MTERELWILGIAVAGPVIGSAIGVSFTPRGRITGDMLAFAGGTMLAISVLELLPEAWSQSGFLGAALGGVIGLLVMSVLEQLFPHHGEQGELKRASLLMILGIFLHNFPEGMAMASAGSMADPRAIITVALAIAVHNIPEGICTSAPYYLATGRRLRAFLWSSSTALPVLGGYLLGRTLLSGMTPRAMGIMVGAVAGLMTHISCAELLPTAWREAGRKNPLRPALWLTAGVVFVLLLERL